MQRDKGVVICSQATNVVICSQRLVWSSAHRQKSCHLPHRQRCGHLFTDKQCGHLITEKSENIWSQIKVWVHATQTKLCLISGHIILRQKYGRQRRALLLHFQISVVCLYFGNYRLCKVQCCKDTRAQGTIKKGERVQRLNMLCRYKAARWYRYPWR